MALTVPDMWLATIALLIPSSAFANDNMCTISSPPPVIHDFQRLVHSLPPQQSTPVPETTAVDVVSLFENGPNPSALAPILRVIANSPQEEGYIRLDLEANATIGTGVVNADVGGNVAFDFAYSVDDQNRSVVSFSVEAALRAGINIADFIRFGGVVEVENDFVRLAFPDSDAAAAWLTDQLESVNRMADGAFWPERPADQPHLTAEDAPLSAPAFSVAGGAYLQAGLRGFEGLGQFLYQEDRINYTGQLNGAPIDIDTLIQRQIGTLAVTIPVNGSELEVEYTRDWNDTTGSPFYYANGIFIEHTLDVRIPVRAVERILRTSSDPRGSMQDLVQNAMAGIERVAPGARLKSLNYNVFSQLVEHIYGSAGRQTALNAETFVTLRVVSHYYGESDGTENLMYDRVLIGGEQTVGADIDARVAQVAVTASIGKYERIYEHLGTQTVSYVQRQFIYQTDDRPWSGFVQNNRDELDALLQNISTPGHWYHDADVAAAYAEGGFDAGLTALQDFWLQQDAELAVARQGAIELARLSEKWTWGFRQDTLTDQMSDILESVETPEARAFMLELIDDYGGTPDTLTDYAADDSAEGRRLRGLIEGAQTLPGPPET